MSSPSLRSFAPLLIVASLWLLQARAHAQPRAEQAEEVELYDYVVKSGDSCAGIARRELGDPKAYKIIHKHNALGPLPHKLRPGQVLRLPRAGRRPDATLRERSGDVQFRRAAEPSWDVAKLGMALFRSWRVWSKQRASAVVEFQDASTVSMRDDTVVIIFGPSFRKQGLMTRQVELESGSLRSRLEGRGSRLVVATASSTAELGEGSAILSAEASNGRSTVSNHEGVAVAVRGKKRRRPTSVSAGKGTWIELGKDPAPPRDLPPAPLLALEQARPLGLASTGVTVRGSWSPVSVARQYRVEIALDPQVRIVAASFLVDRAVTSFEARGLKAGTYYVSVAAIDEQGLESVPSQRQVATAIALRTRSDSPRLEEADSSAADGPSRLALGSVLELPEGLRCSLTTQPGTAAVGASLSLLERGRQELRCEGDAGQDTSTLTLLVEGPRLEARDPSSARAALLRGEEQSIFLASSRPLASEQRLWAQGGDHVELELRRDTEGGIELRVRPLEGAPELVHIQIMQESAAGAVVLSELELRVADAPEVTEEPLPHAMPRGYQRYQLGLSAGALSSRRSSDEEGDALRPLLGVRGTWRLSRQLALESEVGLRLASTSSVEGAGAMVQLLLAYRFGLMPRWDLLMRGGAALWAYEREGDESSADLGAVLSLGIEHAPSDAWRVRVEVDDYGLTEQEDELGVSLSLLRAF